MLTGTASEDYTSSKNTCPKKFCLTERITRATETCPRGKQTAEQKGEERREPCWNLRTGRIVPSKQISHVVYLPVDFIAVGSEQSPSLRMIPYLNSHFKASGVRDYYCQISTEREAREAGAAHGVDAAVRRSCQWAFTIRDKHSGRPYRLLTPAEPVLLCCAQLLLTAATCAITGA